MEVLYLLKKKTIQYIRINNLKQKGNKNKFRINKR